MNNTHHPRRKKQHQKKPRRTTQRQPANARELAFVVLDEYKRSSSFVTPLIDEWAAKSGISSDDRRFASELIIGVVRRRATLDSLIEPLVTRPRHNIEGALWTLLQMGAYQLTFMTSVPAHAAVHETVETARKMGKPRWCGFLNGVLRGIDRSLTEQYVDQPACDAIPTRNGQYRLCQTTIFPDPSTDAGGYLDRAFSLPNWLVLRWQQHFDFEELCRLGFWFNTPPKICLRVNTLKTTREEFLNVLTEAGIGAHAGELDETVWLERSTRIETLPGFAEGWFAVQDESAMKAARLLAPRPGECVLDLCAAPGTKSTHLAQLMNNEGTIVAADVQSDRLERIEQNCRRLGIEIIQPALIEKDGSNIPSGTFDAVLVDVPCSNTGVLAKRPEARWRLQPSDVVELAALQERLLSTACDRVKPGGRLVYSTCSTEPEENARVVDRVLRERPNFKLIEQLNHRPGLPCDGGYQALLHRIDGRGNAG